MKILPEDVKRGISPAEFYADELPAMPTPKRYGWNDGGLCPFHADARAGSFRVHTETGGFHCFACGAKGGDIMAFTMLRDGLSFRETLNHLADNWGVRA